MSWQQRIEANPEVLVGKPVVKGTRLAVEFVIDLLAQEWSEQDILRNYPGLAHEDIQACLAYASQPMGAKKTFHCVEMKHRGAEKVQAMLKGMTLEEQVAYWERRAEEIRKRKAERQVRRKASEEA